MSSMLYCFASVVTRERSEKLVILLAVLESLFLKNDSEPIQQNLGERLALLSVTNIENRKRILATTRQIYAVRSRFVHRGKATIENVALLDRFMGYSSLSLLCVIAPARRICDPRGVP